jgi:hypothetical protein
MVTPVETGGELNTGHPLHAAGYAVAQPHAGACHSFAVGCIVVSTKSKQQYTPPEWES